MTLKKIEVSDDLTGDKWTIKELAPGESKTFNAKYTVTEKDAEAGSVKNVATATGETVDPDGEPEIVPGETDTPIAPPVKPERRRHGPRFLGRSDGCLSGRCRLHHDLQAQERRRGMILPTLSEM